MIIAVPSWLYKYTTAERALQTLRDGNVYFAARHELNDPFDCRFTPDLSTLEKKKRFVQLQLAEWKNRGFHHCGMGFLDAAEIENNHKRLVEDPDFADNYLQEIWKGMNADKMGVYCLTEVRNSLPMWAHYASNHAGCCLEFNFEEHALKGGHDGKNCFPFTFLKMVEYSLKCPLATMEPNRDSLGRGSAILTKSTEWKNEKEWRAIMLDARVKTPLSGKSLIARDKSMFRGMKGAGLYKADEGILRGVILGCEMAEADKADVIAAARECGARVYQATPKTFEFGLDITLVQDKPGNRA